MINFWKRIMFCLMTLALIAGAVSLPLAEDGPAFVMAANAEGVGSPVIPPHEHRGGGATCTQAGVCDVCGEVYIDPQGHDWGAWTDYRYNLKTNLITQRRVCRLNEEHEEWQDITMPAPDPNAPKRLSAGTYITAKNGDSYQVLKNGNVSLVSYEHTDATSIYVPNQIEVNGVEYPVSRIGRNAFKKLPQSHENHPRQECHSDR